MGLPMLDVDDANHLVSGDDRDRKKGLERIFRKISELLETMIFICLPGDGKQASFPGYPAGETFVHFEAHPTNRVGMLQVGSAQDQLVAIDQVDEAGIRTGKLNHQRDDSLQDLQERHFADHEAANLLKQAQLLLGPGESFLQIFCLCHRFIIV